jgi:hypothetical protein
MGESSAEGCVLASVVDRDDPAMMLFLMEWLVARGLVLC